METNNNIPIDDNNTTDAQVNALTNQMQQTTIHNDSDMDLTSVESGNDDQQVNNAQFETDNNDIQSDDDQQTGATQPTQGGTIAVDTTQQDNMDLQEPNNSDNDDNVNNQQDEQNQQQEIPQDTQMTQAQQTAAIQQANQNALAQLHEMIFGNQQSQNAP